MMFVTLQSILYLFKISLIIVSLLAIICSITVVIIINYLRWKYSRLKSRNKSDRVKVVFFHPYCNAGGGGERVLWCSIQAVQEYYSPVEIVVFTGDLDASPADIIKRANMIFNIKVKENIKFIYLHRRNWIEAKKYPYFTLLGQSLGSVWLALEALNQYQPDIFIDTMGYSFSVALFKYVGNCQVASYVHYPTITREMMKRVSARTTAHNNRGIIARSPFLTSGKLIYYRLFGAAYSWAGRANDCVMVNSTWTEDHVNSLWDIPLKTHRVYPPCDVHNLKKIPHNNINTVRIVSVGQFRPEKDHALQLHALYELRNLVSEQLWETIKFVFVGSVRNDEDRTRVKDLQDLSKHLSLENNVEWYVNASHEQLLEQFSRALIGLHAMWNEHFGIGVVECMAAGLITIAHRSGGPLTDIIETSEGSRTGFLASSCEEYAYSILDVMRMTREQLAVIRNAARASVDRFTENEFRKGFLRAIDPLFK